MFIDDLRVLRLSSASCILREVLLRSSGVRNCIIGQQESAQHGLSPKSISRWHRHL